jgi:hypothetical protein
MDIWMPEVREGPIRWVTAGADGRVKYWHLDPARSVAKGKKTTHTTDIPGVITCLFTSRVAATPFADRPDSVKRRQHAKPDEVLLARCSVEHGVVCGVTGDGDLRVWSSVAMGGEVREVRLDVGAMEVDGPVDRLELDVRRKGDTVIASVFIHRQRASVIDRYDLEIGGFEPGVKHRTYSTPLGSSLTALYHQFSPSLAISRPPLAAETLSARIISPGETDDSGAVESGSPPAVEPLTDPLAPVIDSTEYGRMLVAGDDAGNMWIWPLDSVGVRDEITPIRAWEAMGGKITAIDVSCSLVAVGRYVPQSVLSCSRN